MNYKKILETVNRKNLLGRIICLVLATFLLSFVYVMFLLPNGIITGGVSGLGTIVNHLFGFDAATFILVANIILIVVSFIFLGKEKTAKTIVGSILYPAFISLSGPLVERISPYLEFDNFLIPVIIMTTLYGISSGIIYKTGFTTGGSDILMQLVNKYFNIPLGKANLVTSFVLLACGGFTFGLEKLIYSIAIIYVSMIIVDRINIGISDSKMFFIYTKKIKKVEEFIFNEINAGVTIIKAEGGFSKKSNDMLMCVVPTRDYFLFKDAVLDIDAKAFFVISDCYEVAGGIKRDNFIHL